MRFLGTTLALLLASGSSVYADEAATSKRDMSKLTCGEFLEMSAPDAIVTLFWIDGYLSSKDNAPVWDAETFVEHRDKLVKICTSEDAKGKFLFEEVEDLN
ncbi:HdeA/HdeB family chaperone [Pseudovibrio ascidiaceicola]|uniref:HdeA/HdeB family chaperone n=1 Tax=Pseudovibrio ascidiaceicola TaxID=285279 RepID=UPI000D68A472|nr:HdeA/HdeB family chaperone [Pseudovibrio ascidiaceicola]